MKYSVYHYTRRYMRSTKIRILAVFLAVLIFSLSFLDLLGRFSSENQAEAAVITTGTKASDYMPKGVTGRTTHDGHSVVKSSLSDPTTSSTFSYEYTGKAKSTKVSLYDYKSDNEINNQPISNWYTNYGSEPFNQLNTAISNKVKSTAESQNQNNITIRFKIESGLSWWDEVYVHLFDDNDHYVGGNDSKYKMTKDTIENDFYITFNLVDSTADNYLDFVPTQLYFHNKYYNEERHNRTSNLNATLIQGYTYRFKTNEVNKETINGSEIYKAKRMDKTTIIFNDVNNIINDNEKVYLYMWDKTDSTRNNSWPGNKMTYIGDHKFQLDFYGDYGQYKNFDPYNYILTKDNNNKWIDSDLCFNRVLKYGWTYEFTCEPNSDNNGYDTTIYKATNPTQTALSTSAKVCAYDNPLYFGCYYRTTQLADTYADDFKPDGVSKYTNIDFGGPYRNFWWQANLGLKSKGDGSGNNSVDVRGHAAVQGLVDDKLTLDADPSTATPSGALRQDGVELPYFSTSFETAHSDLMKIINNNGAGIDFPFYEIKANAYTVRGNVTDSSAEARFYQFNSAESNLHLTGTSGNWSFEETGIQIASNNSNAGFFPFDSQTSNLDGRVGIYNNVGFGTKFEMRFKLKEDGKVWPVDSDGNDIKDKGKINTMFEFIGDDDLWVFIDGNLVLDLGGCHDQTSGLIDFAEKKAYANKAMNIKAPGNDKNNLGAAVSIQTLEEDAFTNKINGYNSSTGYDKNVTHTMTIFYLERGMMDSNLLVRFNFTPESTFSKMKIAEVTSFSNVNDGLKSYARQAANKDVFKYTVSNKGTSTSDVVDTGILYPTYDQYDRENHYITEEASTSANTTLTKTDTAGHYDNITYDSVNDPNVVFLDAGVWQNDSAYIGAIIWQGSDTSNGAQNTSRLYKGKRVNGNVFRFDGFPSTVDKIKFIRINPNTTNVWGGVRKNYDYANCWGDNYTAPELTLHRGKKYTVSGWGTNTVAQVSNNDTNYSYQVLHYENNTYNPSTADESFKPVANTNYLWEDNFKALKGTEQDSIVGMTGKTNENGELYLMYGSGRPYGDGRESSAEFENSFKPGTITNGAASTMKVVQSDKLYSASNAIGNAFNSTATDRSRSKYYKTSVQLFDRQSNTLTLTQNRGTDVETTFPFRHVSSGDIGFSGSYNAVPDYLTVMLTEVFTNEVRVGAISVTKTLANSETGPDQDHTFKLTLTNVLGQSGVDVTNYSSIPVDGATTSYLSADGSFTIHGTRTATITGIPVDTTYNITETTPGTYFEYDANHSTNISGTIAEGTGANNATPDSTNEVTITNKRKTGDLTLSKSLVGASNASTPPNSTTPFTLRVTLNAPAGQHVNLENYFNNAAPTITSVGTTGAIALDSHSSTQYVVDVTVYPKDNVNNNTVTINGIPYGTTVTVSEEQDANKPQATYSYTVNGNAYEQTIETPTTVVNVTNIYRKVTMTKKDDKDTSKTLSGAKYVLVKLKSTAYSGDSLMSETITAFNNATETDFTTSLTAYIDSYSNVLTTSNGIVEVNDAMMTNGLTPGKYFFVELSPPENYKKNNDSSITYKNGESTGTQNKVITISENVPSNDNETLLTIDYYNERKTGTLELKKSVASGSPKNETFTFNVTLSGTDDSLKLSLYGITGFNTVNYDDANHTATATVTVAADGSATISNIPFGTTYTVDETSVNGWVKVDTEYSDNNKKIDTEPGTNDKVTITNAKTAEMNPAYLMLYEHINEWRPTEWGDPTFIFKITQTKYADDTDVPTANQTTHIVALTVDDDGKVTTDTVLGNDYKGWYQESTDETENGKLEYQGMYHIDNQGRIRLEPGTYSITRVPVSRYEFVADTWAIDSANPTFTANTTGAGCATGLESAVSVTVNDGQTALVHYYDKVAYYDKFSHVDEEINKFYRLDVSKNNTTAKGIRVEFNGKVNTSGTATIYTAQDNSTAANTFNAWFINVDGTEREMTVAQKEKLEIEIPGGLPSDFEYISTNHTLSINNAQSYANNVYTLTAVYKDGSTDLFETTFDLVFARS